MNALSLADVFAPDDFPPSAADHAVERQFQYLDRCRRLPIGPAVTVVFENRQTLWFRIQELAQVARATDPDHIQPELNWYSKLLPGQNRLHAAVWVAEPGRRPSKALAVVRLAVANGRIGFRADDGHEVAGTFRTNRVNDHLIGLALWAEFHFTGDDRTAFADANRIWHLFVEAAGYCHEGNRLSPEVRESLLQDLGDGE
ncbi:DUF3501 family protein [Fimbriiglobus ruber]|uniref:Uncharacterized protein n=1 Tax=Fimbriiglobus ruber TaxID=1908690 RepID=A0A225DRL6_9BACT|nr:DUF3501 family protein [Fimbriiglobus ruber]OWK40216.1 hypothetical protein FRUB_05135 [Fimbriiglobus ruber]